MKTAENRYPAKMKRLHRQLKHRPADRQALLDLCLLCLKQGEYGQALARLTECRKDTQAIPEFLDRMEAIIRFSSGDVGGAKRLFDQLVERGEQDPEIEQYLARIAVQDGDLAQAIGHLEKALELGGRGGELLNDLGVLYFLANRSPEAESCLAEAIRQEPDYAQSYRNLADLTEKTRGIAEARVQWQRYRQRFPQAPDGPKRIGILAYREDLFSEADRNLREAEALAPKDAEIPYYLGMINLRQNDFEMARHGLRKSLALDPGLEPAREALALCYCRLEGANQAYELLKGKRADFSRSCGDRPRPGAKDKPIALSVLLPTFNEADRILSNVREIKHVLAGMGIAYEIVLVDDGSQDDTYEIVEMLSRAVKELRIYRSEKNIGKGAALRQASLQAAGGLVAFLDADLELHPRLIGELIRRLEAEGADVVLGSKRHPGSVLRYPWQRKLISNLYYWVNRVLFGIPVKDTQTGIKVFKKKVLEEVLPKLIEKKYAFDLELIVNIHARGYRIVEAPITLNFSRKASRIGLTAVFRTAIDTLAIFYRLRILRYYDRPTVVPRLFPRVSIVIPFKSYTAYAEESLRACLGLDYPDFEVILLPDGPLTIDHPQVRVIPTGAVPPSTKREAGVAQSTGEIIAFLDDDAYPTREWLRRIVGHFADPGVAAVGGPAVTPEEDDFRQRLGGAVFASPFVSGRYTYRYIPKRFQEVEDYPSCNLAVRKADFLAAGGFNTRYWPGEDTLLCLHLLKGLGKKILYEPDAVVRHHRRRLFRDHLRQVAAYALHRGFFVKRFPGNSRKAAYFIPSLFVAGLVAGPALAWWSAPFAWLFGAGLAVYAGLISLPFLLSLDLKTIALGVAGTFATHVTYGIAFLVGLGRRELRR